MLGFLINSVLADPAEEYPRLSASESTSQDYEIVKLIDGPIDALYQINNQSLFIAQSNHDLWKINAAGEVIDHFSTSDLYSSGLILEEEGFIDWVFTRDKQQKNYGEKIDASGYSEQQLLDAFNDAEIVEFLDKNDQGSAYLYQNGKVNLLDISNQREKITDLVYMSHNIRREYNIHQGETEINGNRFENYNKKPPLFAFIKSQSSLPRYAAITGYEKIAYHRPYSIANTLLENILGAIFVSNHRTREFGYEVGYSHMELKIKDQVLKFSVLSDEQYSSGRSHDINWLDPDSADPTGLKFMAVNYRRKNLAELNERSLLPYYENDIGLYVLRAKTPHNQFAQTAWQLSYSGLYSYNPIWGYLKFVQTDLAPAYYWFRKSRPLPSSAIMGDYGRRADIVSPILKALPKSLTFNWVDFKDRSFRLVINSRDALFYNPEDTLVAVKLEFDSAEMEQAFQKLEKMPGLSQLTLHMVEKPYGAELKVYLQNSSTQVPLKKIHFDYQEQAYTPKSPHLTQSDGQLELFAAYEDSLLTSEPNDFLEKTQELIEKGELSQFAPQVSYYFAQLSYQFSINNALDENTVLMDFYFEKIHSLINYNQREELQHKNLIVFASQVIYTGSNTNNPVLTEKAINTFVEQDFDLEKETDRAFLFNVACYYARNHVKDRMLKIINRAIALGRDPQTFLKDSDFSHYWQDTDFLDALKPVAVTAP
ncbi:hypothetical protein O59_002536 [Cellvibrio sp. BR]|uniref:TPR end-of-group domain-containing protein n=1 Tax=Cellvibrio sp. BR TaxID=1134474 RepID=UPI00026013D5|nr:hypothetical protein [Cellvibrio sp. BR]EIK44812.1 hypothetical protein O59_002536 [Cellvibrio sp. BR]